MKLVTEKDELLRRYLLDEMSDEERQTMEEKFLTDDSLFDELNALEDELYYDYKQGNLSANEKIAFEKKFFSTPEDIEKADFAETFLQITDEMSKEKAGSTFLQSIVAFFTFSNGTFRLGTAAASLLILFLVGFLILSDFNRKPDVADVPEVKEIPTPIPTPIDNSSLIDKQKEQEELQKKLDEEKQKREQDANKINELEKQKEKIQQEIEANRNKKIETPPQKTFIALILSPVGINRGSGAKTAKINLSPEIKTINLTLPIKKDFQEENFKVAVRNIDSGVTIQNSPTKNGKKTSVSLSLSAQKLLRGAYEVVLISDDGEELDSYYFNLEKK
jgi:hypothetical protein